MNVTANFKIPKKKFNFKFESRGTYNYPVGGSVISYVRSGIRVPVVRAIPLWICGALTSVAGARRGVPRLRGAGARPRGLWEAPLGHALATRAGRQHLHRWRHFRAFHFPNSKSFCFLI